MGGHYRRSGRVELEYLHSQTTPCARKVDDLEFGPQPQSYKTSKKKKRMVKMVVGRRHPKVVDHKVPPIRHPANLLVFGRSAVLGPAGIAPIF